MEECNKTAIDNMVRFLSVQSTYLLKAKQTNKQTTDKQKNKKQTKKQNKQNPFALIQVNQVEMENTIKFITYSETLTYFAYLTVSNK